MSQAEPGLSLALHELSVAPPGAHAGPVLHGLSFELAAGEQVAVIGASGAGKTTLLLALAAALKPQAGSLSLGGEQPWHLSTSARQRLRARLVLAPQVPPLPPRQRVITAVLAGRLPQQSLAASLRTLWSPSRAEAALALAALAELGLAEKLWLRVDRLSGGERQRVALARLLVAQAGLWLVDEPLSALDPRSAGQVMAALTGAARAQGATLVCSLHQVAVARECFGRVLALRAGRLVYDGPAAGLDEARLAALYGGEPAEEGWEEGGAEGLALGLGGHGAAIDPSAPASTRPGTLLPGAMCR